jgi:hypothetical protein
MGAKSSTIHSEIFLQYIEFKFVIKIISKYKVLEYFLFLDDALIVY